MNEIIIFALLIERRPAFLTWLKEKGRLDNEALLARLDGKALFTEPGYCPVHGGDSSEAWRFIEDTRFGDQELIALGFIAALSYGDQGTGADVVGIALQMFRKSYPRLHASVINQIHDEIVFVVDEARAEDDVQNIARVMTEAGNRFTMPYGVPFAADALIGHVWLKEKLCVFEAQ